MVPHDWAHCPGLSVALSSSGVVGGAALKNRAFFMYLPLSCQNCLRAHVSSAGERYLLVLQVVLCPGHGDGTRGPPASSRESASRGSQPLFFVFVWYSMAGGCLWLISVLGVAWVMTSFLVTG